MKKFAKLLGYALITILLCTTTLYVVLVSMQAYSKRQASEILDRLEALRIGDPQMKYDEAIHGCSIEKDSFGTRCVVIAGAYRFGALWRRSGKLPEPWVNQVWSTSNNAGLRYWRLDVSSSATDGRISSVTTGLYLVGRYEALGAQWDIATTVPSRYTQYLRAPYDQRTYMTWYHITSRPSGEGFAIHATPETSQEDLLARRVNRKCLFSFRGCDGLCELLPDAVPVLEERHTAWGGCSDVPRSWCDLKNDNCRQSFR